MLIGSSLPFLFQELSFAPSACAGQEQKELMPADQFLKWLPIAPVEAEAGPVEPSASPVVVSAPLKRALPLAKNGPSFETPRVEGPPVPAPVRAMPAMVEMAPELAIEEAPRLTTDNPAQETDALPGAADVRAAHESPLPVQQSSAVVVAPGAPSERLPETVHATRRTEQAAAIDTVLQVETEAGVHDATPRLEAPKPETEFTRPEVQSDTHLDAETEMKADARNTPPQVKPREPQAPARTAQTTEMDATQAVEPAGEVTSSQEKTAARQPSEPVEAERRASEPEPARVGNAVKETPAGPEVAAPAMELRDAQERPRMEQVDAPKPRVTTEPRAEAEADRPSQAKPLSFLRVTSPTPTGGKVEVIARQRGDVIEATVKPSDPALHTVLQRNLPSGIGELRSAGVSTVEVVPPQAATRAENGSREDGSSSSQDRPQQDGSQHRRGRQRHAWDFEEFELQ